MTVKATPIQRINDRSALLTRYMMDTDMAGVGVVQGADLGVVAGSGMQSSIAAGRARIRSNYLGVDRGVYELWNDAAVAATHVAADPSNPRIDQILARIKDSDVQGGVIDSGDFYVAAGVATSGTTLDLRTGAATPDPNTLLLADALVPAGAGSAAAFTYRDRRQFATFGQVPPMMSAVEQVLMLPRWTMLRDASLNGAVHNNIQTEVLCYLPQRITATKIRWSYFHTTTLTGNYNIGIYDSSGRKIVETGVTAFTGTSGVNAQVNAILTIASTTFEAGMYRVMIGFASLNAGVVTVSASYSDTTQYPGTMAPNVLSGIGSGGTTLPIALQAVSMLDAYSNMLARIVPVISLTAT